MNTEPKKPELMSPAGDWPQLEAAIAAGADAVYFGLQHFSARAKVGFSVDELPQVIRTLHRDGLKGFVTFNTLVFDHELAQAQMAIAESGADAIIVQDIGIAHLARQIAPELEVHGSTQMSITSAQGAELAASLGCTRVVLGRELDLANIRKIADATEVELEVFVHGALCVSYSGQCFSSEAWGGRSANRGQCAQACRLSYNLIVDDQPRDLGEFRYLLSPGDLHAIDQIPELIDIGVACFKIEGRYKNADYVLLTTRAYRQAIDTMFPESLARSSPNSVNKNELEQVYSRGLGPHFISGTNHQSVVEGRAPRHRGLRVATVIESRPTSVVVDCLQEIRGGDGLVFDAAHWRSPDEREEGGHVFDVLSLGTTRAELAFGSGDVDFARIRPGDIVWRTNDPKLTKKIRQSGKQRIHTTGIRFTVDAKIGQPLVVAARTQRNETAKSTLDQPLAAAKTRALDSPTLEAQLARLGGTPFHLLGVELESDESVFCPVSQINRARREIVEQLIAAREAVKSKLIASAPLPICRQPMRTTEVQPEPQKPQLHILVRNAQQLDVAIDQKPASITLDYLELYGLRPSVEKIKEAGITPRVASPRVLKPSEQNVVRFLLPLGCQILVRSGGLLHDLVTNYAGQRNPFPELHGDFSLNAANVLAFDSYLEMGLNRLTPTHDLNAEQVAGLMSQISADQIEVVAFQHLPIFHTEHCVFCRFLSNGTDNTNCGHPCEKHTVSLQDAGGRQHAVLADVGCRNTVFNAKAQTAAKHLDRWIAAGLRHFRLEFVHQGADDVARISASFQEYFDHELGAKQLVQRLQTDSGQGITEGSLYVPDDFKQLVQLS